MCASMYHTECVYACMYAFHTLCDRRNSLDTTGEGRGLFCNSCLNKLSVTVTVTVTVTMTVIVTVIVTVTVIVSRRDFRDHVTVTKGGYGK